VSGVGLSVFGFQESAQLGWRNPVTGLSIALGVVLLVAFVRVELRTEQPLMQVRIFRDRTFFVENIVLFVAMMAFVPVFFFASEYAQISLAEPASKASLTLLYFFIGFVVAAQIGGRMLDRIGAKRPVVLGSVLAAVAFGLWAERVSHLAIGQQIWCIILAGAGMGLMLGQANTDALNRAPSTSYGEATGITQTVRNYGASLGLAILGTLAPDDLARAIAAGDKTSLSRPSGVGPKLAARLAVELKDKVSGMALGPASASLPESAAAADAVSALVNLGYRRAEAFDAVATAARRLGAAAAVDALIRAGLKELSQ
jgi:hypothetical protein